MNITVEKQPKCLASMTAEIPADKVASERSSIVGAYKQQANIKGFRPGKVPQSVIEKRFAKQIGEELEDSLVRAACDEAIKKENLNVIDVKRPKSSNFGDDGSFKFQTSIILAPDVSIPEYKGLDVKVPNEAPTDNEFDLALENLRQRFADHDDIEDRAIEDNDIAVIDFKSTLDGKPVEEAVGKPVGYLSGREDFWIRIEEDSFLPGFYKELIGLNIGDSKDITQKINEDFPVSELREKEVVFAVTVKGIKEMKLPEIDDEFAEKLVPGKGIDGLKEALMEQLEGDKKRQIADSKVQQIVSTISEGADFELPEELVNSEAQSQANQMVQQAAQQGMENADLEAQQDEILQTARLRAEGNLRSNFILQKIAEAEKIEIADQDILQRITVMAQQARTPVKKYIKELQKNNQIESIRMSVLIGKTIDFLVEQANVTELSEEEIKEINEQSAE